MNAKMHAHFWELQTLQRQIKAYAVTEFADIISQP